MGTSLNLQKPSRGINKTNLMIIYITSLHIDQKPQKACILQTTWQDIKLTLQRKPIKSVIDIFKYTHLEV